MTIVLQHKMNTLHIYCRLMDMHIPKRFLVILRLYERWVHPFIYKGTVGEGT